MSDSDEIASMEDSTSHESSSESGDSEEMEVVGIVQPYADELLAHTSDEDEDDEEDHDGLTPAVLRARFENTVSVNDWLVILRVRFLRVEGETYWFAELCISVCRIFSGCMFVDTSLCLYCRCTCGECAKEILVGALEHRCCMEVDQARHKLTLMAALSA
ncbi:hypothetical protein OS493_036127 [Desmophyllum pertusum]|uniref:Uncharacterized protein n=1 Tax=Desmophyllum pertusum TaxID=174260 RepID=A0A9W9Y7H1_9CNID|nr:hypothetical protein OS493_036127 [Desmophyllum pertusum]